MTTPDVFTKFPSIPRMSKERVTVTEKIDGSNAGILILPEDIATGDNAITRVESKKYGNVWIYAQSRSRYLGATKATDNFGFASWVWSNSAELVDLLGPGRHMGEWWGSKIQRGYGLTNGERKFSLFNASRWYETLHHIESRSAVDGLLIVPTLFNGRFYDFNAQELADELGATGSKVVPGFKAEGMVVYLRELGASYKVLLEGDEIHKWEASG